MIGTVVKNGKLMRLGYTTGSCAAAAAKAAAATLFSGRAQDVVELETPGGKKLYLDIVNFAVASDCVTCGVKKDSGDDPDVTDGIMIYASVKKTGGRISIEGGKGIGRVTKPGLACKVNEAAINPVPRKMIEAGLREIADRFSYRGGFSVTISAPEGERIAQRTFNPRLGIVGGISILGTTGIVEPMSEAALVDTIKVEIDSRVAGGNSVLLLTPGNYGRDFALSEYGIDLETGVKCANYIGEALDYAVYKNIKELLLTGHAGKIVKLAAGVMNTHSRIADCRAEIISAHAALAGADRGQVKKIMECATTDEMHRLLKAWGLAEPVWKSILFKILEHVNYRTGGKCQVEVTVFSIGDGVLAVSEHAAKFAGKIRAMGEKT